MFDFSDWNRFKLEKLFEMHQGVNHSINTSLLNFPRRTNNDLISDLFLFFHFTIECNQYLYFSEKVATISPRLAMTNKSWCGSPISIRFPTTSCSSLGNKSQLRMGATVVVQTETVPNRQAIRMWFTRDLRLFQRQVNFFQNDLKTKFYISLLR